MRSFAHTAIPAGPTSGETHGITRTDSTRAFRRPGLARPGMSGPHWQEMCEAAIDFLDRFGEDVVAFGCTATDLFGMHPTVDVVRVDYCGGLMINARCVEAILDAWIRCGSQTFRRDRPERPVGVSV